MGKREGVVRSAPLRIPTTSFLSVEARAAPSPGQVSGPGGVAEFRTGFSHAAEDFSVDGTRRGPKNGMLSSAYIAHGSKD
ncbi:hypothetical protein AOLI_G00078180 [Acnodon oligacanthus]